MRMLQSQAPIPQNVTDFGKRVFKEMMRVNYGRALIRSGRSVSLREIRTQTGTQAPRETSGEDTEDSHPDAKEGGLGGNQPCQRLGLGRPASRA